MFGSVCGDAQPAIQHLGLIQQLLARALVHAATALQDDGLLGDAQDLVRVLLHQDHRGTALANEVGDDRQQFLLSFA